MTNNLLSDARQWKDAEDLRNYICATEKNGKYSDEWIKWAKDKADWIDPLIKEKDNILGDYDESGLDKY